MKKTVWESLNDAVEAFDSLPDHVKEAARKSGTMSTILENERFLKEQAENDLS